MSAETIEKILEIIDQRRTQVLEANGLSANTDDPNNIQYAWITGIYDDIIQCIKAAS
jgi:hypothetical protein